MSILLLLLGLLSIVMAAHGFTTLLDRVADRFGLQESVVGSLVAAVATALPETIIPLLAVGVQQAPAVGLGAAVGATLMLSTLTMGLLGVAGVLMRGPQARLSGSVAAKQDIRLFLAATLYGALLLVLPWHTALVRQLEVLPFGIAYGWRVVVLLKMSGTAALEPPDKVANHSGSITWLLLGLLFFLLLMLGGSALFVDQVQVIARIQHLSPLILALLVSPIATELPEKLNSVLWLRRGKDQTALGNITGAMAYQSCILTGINVAGGAWQAGPELLKALCITIVAGFLLLWQRSWSVLTLSAMSLLYGLFWMWCL